MNFTSVEKKTQKYLLQFRVEPERFIRFMQKKIIKRIENWILISNSTPRGKFSKWQTKFGDFVAQFRFSWFLVRVLYETFVFFFIDESMTKCVKENDRKKESVRKTSSADKSCLFEKRLRVQGQLIWILSHSDTCDSQWHVKRRLWIYSSFLLWKKMVRCRHGRH